MDNQRLKQAAEAITATGRIATTAKVVANLLTPSEQIQVAELILANHSSMALTLTKHDATQRIMERYKVDSLSEAEKISEQFFASKTWEEKRESAIEQYWEFECGAEVLFSPLDDWMHDHGLQTK